MARSRKKRTSSQNQLQKNKSSIKRKPKSKTKDQTSNISKTSASKNNTTTTFQKAEKKSPLPIITLKAKPKVIIPNDVQDIIDVLHSKVRKGAEWSGILVFKDNDQQTSPDKLEIEIVGIYPCHIGTAVYTEIDSTKDRNYTAKVGEASRKFGIARNQYRLGLIHTHHNMSTGFSGTDMDELQDNTENYEYYLSLIVNYAGTYSAKLSMVCKGTTMHIQEGALTYNVTFKQNNLIVCDCEVVTQEKVVPEIPWLTDQIDALKKESIAAQVEKANRANSSTYSHVGAQRQIGFRSGLPAHASGNPAYVPKEIRDQYPALYGRWPVDEIEDDEIWEAMMGEQPGTETNGRIVDMKGDEITSFDHLPTPVFRTKYNFEPNDLVMGKLLELSEDFKTGEIELPPPPYETFQQEAACQVWCFLLTGDTSENYTVEELSDPNFYKKLLVAILSKYKNTIQFEQALTKLEGEMDTLILFFYYYMWDANLTELEDKLKFYNASCHMFNTSVRSIINKHVPKPSREWLKKYVEQMRDLCIQSIQLIEKAIGTNVKEEEHLEPTC